MILIRIPINHIQERSYAATVLFQTFLGVPFKIETSPTTLDYEVVLPNGNTIIVKDCFFSNYNEEGLGYLKRENIPQKIHFYNISGIKDGNLPVLFGSSEITTLIEGNQRKLVCEIDVFALVFFMLSRWEEFVTKTGDPHGRSLAKDSTASRLGFLDRPIVNEYVELFKSLLLSLDYPDHFRNHRFEIVPTHDVDLMYYPHNPLIYLGDILRKRGVLSPIKRLNYLLRSQNPYDTFDWLMDMSEKQNVKSRFYFMSNGKDTLDNTYQLQDSFVQKTISKIKERDHIIGFHPGYQTLNNESEFERQKEHLESSINYAIFEGRQHFLRFTIPETFRVWSSQNMRLDSSLGYPDAPGFRCGTGNEFPVFDILKRETLALIERPLILMDTSIHSYVNFTESLAEGQKTLNHFKAVSIKYKMPFTVLFHNSSFDEIRWGGWSSVYSSLFD